MKNPRSKNSRPTSPRVRKKLESTKALAQTQSDRKPMVAVIGYQFSVRDFDENTHDWDPVVASMRNPARVIETLKFAALHFDKILPVHRSIPWSNEKYVSN